MNVNVTIDGFKKGNIYLQKIKDSILINVDSTFIDNKRPIVLKYEINSPEIFYINMDISKNDNRIEFFGEKGEINIKTSLKKFNSEFEVSGSLNDSIYRNYLNVIGARTTRLLVDGRFYPLVHFLDQNVAILSL